MEEHPPLKDAEDGVPGVMTMSSMSTAFMDYIQFLEPVASRPPRPAEEDVNYDGPLEEDFKTPFAWFTVNYDRGTIQVWRSAWLRECAWCSPCYPGQGDLESVVEGLGACLAFDVPPEWRTR